MEAIASAIEEGLRKKGEKPLGVEGASQGRWALMDYHDVVAHIFYGPVREFYDLEGLWADADITKVEDKGAARAAKARSRKQGAID